MENKDKKIEMLNSLIFNKNPEEFLENAEYFQKYLMMYECAIKEITTKLEILNKDLKFQNGRSPIEFVHSRVKSIDSIFEKSKKKGFNSVKDSILLLDDIAGIRIICSFIDDIYLIADMLLKQEDITLVSSSDYISNPKENGYRSYHIIIEVPVFFSNDKQNLKVEIQIRTIAMDFWASLEHKLKYKRELKNEQELTNRLKRCADIINSTDIEMQLIREEIEE